METSRWLCQDIAEDGESVQVEGQPVWMPSRLYFGSGGEGGLHGDAGLMVYALRSRSADGHERQRAARKLLLDPRPWSAPFLVALIGEYVVEILADIDNAPSALVYDLSARFIAANPGYWRVTQARVMSYWNEYYRDLPRSEYVGFSLIRRLNAAVALLV